MWKNKLYRIILAAMIFLAGCQKEEKKPVNSLKINFQEGDLPSLHPHALMIYLRGIGVAKSLFECLTRIDPQGKVQLAGAKSVAISSDRLQYIFTLQDNTWSDGTPVTAFQYENAWKEALSPHSACSRADLLYMIKHAMEAKKGEQPLDSVRIKAIDAKTLVIELAYPSPYFLELLAQPICAPLKDPKKKEPTEFNGPFAVSAWKRGDHLQLKPNPYFWDREHIHLKQIDIFMMQDVMTAFSLYEKKELDWIGAPLCPLSTDLITSLKQTHSLKSHPVDRAFWVFLNTQHHTLSSKSIRQALSLAIDRSAITTHILGGGHPLVKPLPSAILFSFSFPAAREDLSEAYLLFEQGLTELGLTKSGLPPLVTAYSQQANRKQPAEYFQQCWSQTFGFQVLLQVLFEQGLTELGLTKSSLPPLVITYSQQANRKQLAEYLQQCWSQTFGIQVLLQAQEWNVLRRNLEKGLFEISGCFEAAFYKDPLELLERFVSHNPCNFSQWVYSPFEEKISSAKKEHEPQRRIELLAEAEQILMEQCPFIPIYSDELLFTHLPALRGYAFDYVGAVDFSHARCD